MLIVFEGIDGSGKSTQAKALHSSLEFYGKKSVLLREPYCRTTLEDSSPAYFLRDRRKHSIPKVKAALRDGAVVIMDRYYYSTMAYQGALGYDVDAIRRDNEYLAPIPDWLFVLHINAHAALSRVKQRSEADSWEHLDYLYDVSRQYEMMSFPYQVNLSGTDSPLDVHLQVLGLVLL